MDYILKTIQSKLRRFDGTAKAKIYYQVRVEYSFYLLLSYFWSQNFEEIGITDFVLQGNIIKEIQKPSIGTIATLIQKLDIHKEIQKSNQKTELGSFAELRNDLIGHGYSFEDDLENYSTLFNEWYERLLQLRVPILTRDTDIIICQNFDEETGDYTGTIYGSDGEVSGNWKCPKVVATFEVNNLYASFEPNNYIRLSPFIHIDIDEDALYVYRGVQQPLIGQIRYNRIDRSGGNYTKCWSEFEFSADNGLLKRQPNGCIMNLFTPNYKRFIEVGSIKDKVFEFLIGKEKGSSVCITLWGHGGNGKTATVQKICEELSLQPINSKFKTPPFEFIIFLTAKDRELNKYTGKIDSITSENRVTTFDDLVEKLNFLIYSEISNDTAKLIAETSKMLLVIDDYETFEDIDKEKITQFIKLLNLNYNKIIITTRNNFLKIGDDIATNELDINNTIKFLFEILINEHQYSPSQIREVENDIKRSSLKEEIHKITLGKPIEIIRFVNCFIQKGKLTDGFLRDMKRINSRSERIEFLYGLNYKQLEHDKLAQDVFVVIGLLTPQESLTSLISHVKLILNKKEEDETPFNEAVDKLVKLRLIDVDEDGSYKVDSKDILEIMKQEFEKRSGLFKSAAIAIYERIKTNITVETDRAILNHVKTLRHQANPETAIQQYKEIIRRGKDFSYEIKKEAFLDLADFLFNHRGEKEIAVKLFDEYFDKYYEFGILKRYASYTWSVNKEKAIRILEDFNSKYTSSKISLSKNQKLHLLGLIVMRETQFWNDKFEKETTRKEQAKDQFSRVQRIYGHQLYAQLKVINPSEELNSEELNDISLALEGEVDILYRLHNKPLAIEICNYVLKSFPQRFNSRFEKKRSKLIGYRNIIKPSRPQESSLISIQQNPIKNDPLEIINLEPMGGGYFGIITKIHKDATNYGYIAITSETLKGRIYFRETSVLDGRFNQLKEGDKVSFGFGKINSYKFGAINIALN